MGQGDQNGRRGLQLADLCNRLRSSVWVFVETGQTRWTNSDAHGPAAHEQGPMVTAVAAHEDPFVRPGQRQPAQVTRHVAWSVNKPEAAVAKEVVCPTKRPQGDPLVVLEAEFPIVRVLDRCRFKRRAWIDRESGCRRGLAPRTGDESGIGKLCAVPDVVEVKMAEDDGVDGGRGDGAFG